MKTLITIDDSDCSKWALESLSCYKWSEDDEIRVITVIDLFEFVPSSYYDETEAMTTAKEVLEKAVSTLKKQFPKCKISSSILRGLIKSSILEICDQWKPDLLCMGSHGRKGFKKFMLGSVSNSLLLGAPCPVLIIKNKSLVTDDKHKTVLISIDNSDHTEKIIETVLNTQWNDDIKFHVMNVVENIEGIYCFDYANAQYIQSLSELRKEIEKESVELIDEFRQRLVKHFGPERVSGDIVHGHVPDAILEQAEIQSAGLIILGSHGKNFVERLIIGSASYSIAVQADCSVQVVKANDIEEKSATTVEEKIEVAK